MEKLKFRKIVTEDFEKLMELQRAYKTAIGEEQPDEQSFDRLKEAMEKEQILFFGCEMNGELIAMCSICKTFSTFDYQTGGVFEDFYIVPAYRHQGIARKLVHYAYEESAVHSFTVGCADCDVEMYQSLGFAIQLGNMLAYDG